MVWGGRGNRDKSGRGVGQEFWIRLNNGKTLVLEVKGVDSEQNQAKRAELARWVKGVNAKGGFGQWASDVLFQPSQIQDVLERHGGGAA